MPLLQSNHLLYSQSAPPPLAQSPFVGSAESATPASNKAAPQRRPEHSAILGAGPLLRKSAESATPASKPTPHCTIIVAGALCHPWGTAPSDSKSAPPYSQSAPPSLAQLPAHQPYTVKPERSDIVGAESLRECRQRHSSLQQISTWRWMTPEMMGDFLGDG